MDAIKIRRAERVRRNAAQSHTQYPQYEGHWDSWKPVEVLRRVVTKAGVAFEKGDVSIVEPLSSITGEFVTVYSFRNGVDTSIKATYVKRLF
jgi:hypothetical protein